MSAQGDLNWRIISLGAMECHPLWGEAGSVRTGHATTTLIRAAGKVILIDPGLPSPVIETRLSERAGLKPADVTHVYLTGFHPHARRGLSAFDHATWWISKDEREGVGVPLAARLRDLPRDEVEMRRALETDVAILRRCVPAPDSLAPRVDLFPLPGVSPGLCGVLIAEARCTTLICGDAIPTIEHLEQGQLPRWCSDVDLARESFQEAVEIADLLVLGRDGVVVNPTKRPF